MNNIMKRSNGTGGIQRNAASTTPLIGLVDDVFNRFFDDGFRSFNGIGQQRGIPVNIRETDNSYEIELVAPGLRKEDFEVRMDDKTLVVSFQHKEENNNESQKGYLRQEYRVQSFTRSFTLDDSIDAEKINARYENGVLWLSLPRKEESQRQRRTIEIQ
jgi:HSP20 family protein